MTTQLVFDQKERIGQWVAGEIDYTAGLTGYYAMGVEQDGEIVAGILFHQFNGSNAWAHIACRKPSRAFVELLKHGYQYAFTHCGLRRLTGAVVDSNQKALKLDLHMGWQEEFVMKQAGVGGEDLHILVLWPENFRYKDEGV